MFMRTYANSRVKRKSFYRKSELQMFLLISGGHNGGPNDLLIWRLRTIYKVAWNVSANNSETVGHKDLRLIVVFYNISFSWLLPLDVSNLFLRCVTVKTIYCLNLFLCGCFSSLHSIMCYIKHVCLTKLTSMDYKINL